MQILQGEEEEGEKGALEAERHTRLKKWQAVISTLDREQLAQETKASQEAMLDDLMGQL